MSLNTSLNNSEEGFANIDSDIFEKEIIKNKKSVLIDVRTKEEFNAERIKDSILIDIYEPDFCQKMDHFDRNNPYYLYCKSGVRSYSACQLMVKMGFKEIYNLRGGINCWHGEVLNE